MTAKQKTAIWGGSVLSIAVIALAALFIIRQVIPAPPHVLTGVVLVDDKDPQKQTPIGFSTITATIHGVTVSAHGDAFGLFHLTVPHFRRNGVPLRIRVESAGFVPRDFTVKHPEELQILHLESVTRVEAPLVAHPILISKTLRVRYTEQTSTTSNVGSSVQVFQIVNQGNVPCDGHAPCSPDGKWRATLGTHLIEGQPDTEFRNVRLTCIAGPCPFSHAESEAGADHGKNLKVAVLNWSDTVTYLFEAEVVQTHPIEVVRQSYAAVYGSSLNFSLPATAAGASIEAEVGGQDIIYPLGPDHILSWAVCSMKGGAEGSKQFHCDLKPQYRFK